MTNFEKWKDALTIGVLAEMLDWENCIGIRCPYYDQNCEDLSPIDCKLLFVRWANEEVKEE